MKISKIIIQAVITLVLLIFIWAAVSVTLEAAGEEEYPDYKVLRSDLMNGRYGSLIDFYDTVNALTGVSAPEYEQYTEFYNFYNDYLLYLEYSGVGDTGKASQYLEMMRRITRDTRFTEVKPHYEYLLTTVGDGEENIND